MCDRSFMLVIFLILKITILVITPILLFYLYKKESRLYTLVGVLDLFFILLFIILRLSGNTCIVNSTFSKIKNNDTNTINENNDSVYESIYSIDQYTGINNNSAYFYSIDSDPLRYVKLSCDKNSYMKNYGSSITAITSLISNYYNVEINEIDLINYLEDNNLIDCEKGIDFLTAFKALQDRYYFDIVEINSSLIDNYVLNGKSILVETQNKYNEDKNFGCEKDYLIIYSINNDGEYSIINSNDKNYDYFCPSNTIGYGSIIEGNQNDNIYSFNELNSKALKYYTIEVRK